MVVTDDCNGFVVVTFAVLVADVVVADEAAVVVHDCDLFAVLGFDAVAAYAVDVLDSRVFVAFHLAVYLVVAAMLNLLDEIKVHVNVVLQVFPVLQEVLTELVHLTDQL